MRPVYSSMGQAIKAAREAAGLTQKEAAALVGKHPRAWQNWELDNIEGLPPLRDIEKALGLEEDWFISQFNALERVLALERQLDRMEKMAKDNQVFLRDILGLLRVGIAVLSGEKPKSG